MTECPSPQVPGIGGLCNSTPGKPSAPGEALNLATPDVVTVPPTTTIMGAIKTMTFYGFSRLPIADAGTKRLIGFVTSVDVVDFLGGGLRHNLLKEKYGGNIFTAINADIREIMSTKLTYASDKSSLNDAHQADVREERGRPAFSR